MTDSMKFGPEWLRNMSNDNLNNTANNTTNNYNNTSTVGGGGGGGGAGNNSTIGPRYQLAEYRYGREEMLSLYDKNTKTPEILPSYKKLFVDKLQCPLALIPTTDEDSPPTAPPGGMQPRSWGVLRSPVFGSGTPIRGTGRGGSVDRGRGGRTRGTFHTSSSYQRPTALYDEDIRGIGKSGGERWHERNGISDTIGQLTNDWNGSPTSSPRKEFIGNNISHSGGSGNIIGTGGGIGNSGIGGRGSNMENWRRTRMDEDSTGSVGGGGGSGGGGGGGLNTSGNSTTNDGWRGGTGGNPTGPGSTYRWARSTSWRDDDSNNINSSTSETQLSTSGINSIGSIQRSFSTTSSVDHRSSSGGSGGTGINSGSTSSFLNSSSHQIQGSVGGTISSMKQHTGSGRNSVPWGGGGGVNNNTCNDNLGSGDHDDSSLPEWAMANPTDSGGSFDATGAFHGSNDEDDDNGSKIGLVDSKLIRLNSNSEINKNNYITNGNKDRKSLLNSSNNNNEIKINHNKIDLANKDLQILKDKKLSENKFIKNLEKNNITISSNNNSYNNSNNNDNLNLNDKKFIKSNQLIGNDFKKSDNINDQKHDDINQSKQIMPPPSSSISSTTTPTLFNTNNNKFLEISDRMQEVADDMVAKLITDDESVNTIQQSNVLNSSVGGGGGGNGNQMLNTNSSTPSTIVEQIHHHQQHHHQNKSQQQPQENQSTLNNPVTSQSTLISPSVQQQQQQQSSSQQSQSSSSSSSTSNNSGELWYYRDPQGKVQGSFTANEMAEWYRAGYFDENLYVRRICDSRFAALGELVKLCGNSMPFLSSHLIPPLTETLSQSTTLQQQQQQQHNNHLPPHQQQLTPPQNVHQLHNITGQQQHIGAPGINQLPSSHQQQSPTQQQQQHPIPGVVSAINAALNKNIITPLLVDGNNTGQQQQSTNLETITLIQQFHYLQKQYTLKQRSQILQNLTNSESWNLLTRDQQQQIINQRLSQIIYPDYLMNLQALSNTLSMGTPASYTLQQMLASAKNEIIQTKITPNWLYNSLGIGQQQHHNISGGVTVDTISSLFNNDFTTVSGITGTTSSSSSSSIVDNQINVNNLLQQSSNNHQLGGNNTGQIPNHQNNITNNNSGITSIDNDPIKSLFMQLQMQKNAAAFASLASVALTGNGNTINHWPTNLPNHLPSHHQQQQQQQTPAWSTAVNNNSGGGGGNGVGVINQQQTIDILNQNMWDYASITSQQQQQQQNNKTNDMKLVEQQIIEEQLHNDKLNRQINNDNHDIDKYIQHNIVSHHYQDQQQQYKIQQLQDLPLEQQQLSTSALSSYNIQLPNTKDDRIHNNKIIIDEQMLQQQQQQHKSNNNNQQKNDDDLLNKQQTKNHISSVNIKNNTNNINANFTVVNKKDNNKKSQQQQILIDDERNKRELIDDKRKQKEDKKQRQQQLEDEQRKRQQQEDDKRREQQQIDEEKRLKDIESHRRRVLMEAFQVASENNKKLQQQQQQRSPGPSSIAPWSNTGLPGITSPGPNFAEIQKSERERRAEEQRLEQILETQRKTQQMEIIAAKETTTLKWKNQSALINNVKSLNEIQAEEAKRLANAQAALAIAEQNRRKDHEQQSSVIAQSSSSGFNSNPFNTIWNNRTTQNIVWNSTNNSIGNIINPSSTGNSNNNNTIATNSNMNTSKVWGGTSTSSAGFWEEPTKMISTSSTTSTNNTTVASVLATAMPQQHGNKNQNRIGLSKSQTIGSMQTVRKDNNNTTVSGGSGGGNNSGNNSNGNFKQQQLTSNKQQNKNNDDKSNGNKKKKDTRELNASGGNNFGATGNNTKKDDARNEFTSWCIKALSLISSSVDVPTFISFLQDIESPFEVKDYIRVYLGETKDCTEFGKQFLERRSKYKNQQRAQNAHIDDMCVPAPAINPSSNEFQEVKGKGKKIKKGKMTKLDARILGFSVTAAQDRINVGDRDYGDAT